MSHTPVLLEETIRVLDPKPGEFLVDGTVGGGGHARAMQGKLHGKGTLLAIDGDRQSLERAVAEIKPLAHGVRFIPECANFADLAEVLARHGLQKPDVILLDLGFSSDQVGAGQGLSFQVDEPLDMRYGVFAGERTAADLVNRWSEPELERRIRELGGERYAKRIAAAIVKDRRTRAFATTAELAHTVARAVPHGYERGRIHPATRTFQALRIAVNRERENLDEFLTALPACIAPGGRAAIISFQSLEDKAVKTAFKMFASLGAAVLLFKKPIVPTLAERRANPRSRSAKLRAVEFLATSH